MKPVKFKEANRCLGKPDNMTDKECSSLYVFTDGQECVSKWKLSFKERLMVLLHGTMWIMILSGHTQPPICLSCHKTIFKKEDN